MPTNILVNGFTVAAAHPGSIVSFWVEPVFGADSFGDPLLFDIGEASSQTLLQLLAGRFHLFAVASDIGPTSQPLPRRANQSEAIVRARTST